MEHPLIGDIGHLTTDELSTTITDLYKKLAIAQRTGNGHLSNQIRMALETYQNQYQKKQKEQSNNSPNSDFSDRISIE